MTPEAIRAAAQTLKENRIMLTEEDMMKAARELQASLQRRKDNRVERTHRTLILALHTNSHWKTP